MTFDQEDFNSRTWKKLKKHIGSQLVMLRAALEKDAPPEKTTKLREHIRALNLLLALETAPAAGGEDATSQQGEEA
jgi:hypothetical protein